MVAKSFKISVALLAVAPLLYGGGFNQQAEKDREALKKLYVEKVC